MKDILHEISLQYSKELELTHQRILAVVHAQSNDAAKNRLSYVISKKGHMLRPLLAWLVYGSITGQSAKDMDDKTKSKMAAITAALELLHTASLVHDDIIDETLQRRGQETINSLEGNTQAVLIGNLFYLNAFRLLLELEDSWYLDVLIDTAEAMCVGEVLQNEKMATTLSPEDYLGIVARKTGALITAAAILPAKLAGADPSCFEFYEKLAMNLGTLYQMRDDLKDGDLLNLESTQLEQLIIRFAMALNEASASLEESSAHQSVLIQFINYFKGSVI